MSVNELHRIRRIVQLEKALRKIADTTIDWQSRKIAQEALGKSDAKLR